MYSIRMEEVENPVKNQEKYPVHFLVGHCHSQPVLIPPKTRMKKSERTEMQSPSVILQILYEGKVSGPKRLAEFTRTQLPA